MNKRYQTKGKTAILDYLRQKKYRGLSAADVFEYLLKQQISINLTTVYRNLEKLTEEGQLKKYKVADQLSCVYQYVDSVADCQKHLHMQCRNCGKILHLECDFMRDIDKHLLEFHNFTLDCNGSVMVGICNECKMVTSFNR